MLLLPFLNKHLLWMNESSLALSFASIALLKKEPKQRKHKKRTSEKMIVFDHLTAHNSTVLNNELNWSNTDWAKEASEIKSLLAKNQNNKCK